MWKKNAEMPLHRFPHTVVYFCIEFYVMYLKQFLKCYTSKQYILTLSIHCYLPLSHSRVPHLIPRNFTPSLLLFSLLLITLNSISALHMHRGMWLCTGLWATDQQQYPIKNDSPSPAAISCQLTPQAPDTPSFFWVLFQRHLYSENSGTTKMYLSL